MFRYYKILFPFLLICISLSTLHSQQRDYSIDSKLSELESRLDHEAQKKDSLMYQYLDSLVLLSRDSFFSLKTRRKAALLVGKLKTTKSIQYLIKNIDYFIYKPDYEGDIDIYLEYPFFFTLFSNHKENYWTLFPMIIEELESEIKNDKEIGFFKLLLQSCISPKENITVVLKSFYIQSASTVKRENLQKLIALINREK